MKTLVIGLPENLPPELADNPDVLVLDPETLGDDIVEALDAASGGMLLGEGLEEGGEGALEDWAKEEEAEHAHGGEGGEEEDEDKDKEGAKGGRGDDEEEDENKFGKGGRGADDEEEEDKAGKGGRGRVRGGRGAGLPPLAAWARTMAGSRR